MIWKTYNTKWLQNEIKLGEQIKELKVTKITEWLQNKNRRIIRVEKKIDNM